MPKTDKYRPIYVLRYLTEQTDDDHPVTLADIVGYLKDVGIEAHPRTVSEDIKFLESIGYDIITDRSTQNRYFLATRDFELPELKLMIDAIQAAKFIPVGRTESLISKVASLASRSQADELERNLYANKQKEENKHLLIVIDQINQAINQKKQITFQYYEYNREGKLVLKYDGYTYKLSPYAFVWNNDIYYVIGYMEKYKKVIKYRVDKMVGLNISDVDCIPMPEEFDLSEYVDSQFLMYGETKREVTLLCEYGIIGKVIDRFGSDIDIVPIDDEHFEITETVAVGNTFFSWLFNYSGKIKISSPDDVIADFFEALHKFD